MKPVGCRPVIFNPPPKLAVDKRQSAKLCFAGNRTAMPSPFPGMNPYLERETVWSDFHTEYCKAIKKALVPQVQPEFYVKFNEHIYVHEETRRLVGLADVGVTRKSQPRDGNGAVGVLDAP